MIENKFRENRMKIKELLIDSFTAENFDVEKYIKTSIPYTWELINLKKVTEGSYENTLIKFVESEPRNNNHSGLIIIGDTGSGKSSSLKYILEKATKCHSCTTDEVCDHTPMIIYFDFLNALGSVQAPNTEIEENECQEGLSEEEFWKELHLQLDKELKTPNGDLKISEEKEKNEFWGWLLSDFRRYLYMDLLSILSGYEQRIKEKKLTDINYDDIKREILSVNRNYEKGFLYKLLQIAFCRREYKGLCHLTIFDNLDSLAPTLQREALRLSEKIRETLSAKVFVPMRPHTFSINSDAANFNEVMSHWQPDIFNVIEFRIKTMIDSKDEEENTLGAQLLEVYNFIVRTKYAKDLFIQTCGFSVRFALRNFYNFLLSPLVYWEEEKLKINSMKSNEFYQAYFCSEIDNQFMYESNFVNLFSLKTPDDGVTYSNIKLRILYLLSKGTGISVREVRNKMELFGYNDVQIREALNDMLRRRTALIWSDSCLQYTEQMLSEPHILKLTPIGKNYINLLTSDLRYMRECVMAKDKNREKGIEYWVLRCWVVFKELVQNDYDEIITYLEKSTLHSYQLLMHNNIESISLFLWGKLREDFKYFANEYGVAIDKDYENAIIKNIISIFKYGMIEIPKV
ncbi:MAG: hypothetical protein LBM67_08915 [Lentimicrobiaceae bacterium]|jgi:hypothetical protein|nr:hypothetical protein [Lentimicrobiaceae bacterium]